MTGTSAVVEFFSDWDIYRSVLDHNCMEHRQIGLAERRLLVERAGGFALADLGCGDCSAIAAVLSGLPVTRFVGIDSAEAAIELAGRHLAGLGADVELAIADLRDYLRDGFERFDVIHLCFALHHFNAAGKREVLAAALDRLTVGGEVLLVDVVRQEGESRAQYLTRYDALVRTWSISAERQQQVMDHVVANDYPQQPSELIGWAHDLGYRLVTPFYSGAHGTQLGLRLGV